MIDVFFQQIIPDTKVDLAEKALTANYSAITLPERGPDVELLLPDIDIGQFAMETAGVRLARFEEITMLDYDDWYTAPTTQIVSISISSTKLINQEKVPTPRVTPTRIVTPELARAPEIMEGLPPEFAVTPPPTRFEEEEEKREMEERAIEVPPPPPVTPTKPAKRRAPKRKYLIFDEETQIPEKRFKRQTQGRDIEPRRERKFAPKTKEQMLRKPPTMDELFRLPSTENIPQEFIDRVSELIKKPPVIKPVPTEEITVPEVPFIEEEIVREAEIVTPKITPIRPSVTPIVTPPPVETPEEKKKREEREKKELELQDLKEKYQPKGLTDKTLKVLLLLKHTFETTKQQFYYKIISN